MTQTFLKRIFHHLSSGPMRLCLGVLLLLGQTSLSLGVDIKEIKFFYDHKPEMRLTLKEQPEPFDLSKESTKGISIDVEAATSYNITVEGVPALTHTNKTDKVPYELTTAGKTVEPEKDKTKPLIEKGIAGKSTHEINVTVKPGTNLSPGNYKGQFTLSIAAA